MNTFDAIEQRRAIKAFDPTHVISAEAEQQILNATLLSPTAFNLQHWRIVKISDPSLREQIKAAAWGQAQVTDASLVYILCADMKTWEKEPGQYWRNAPEDVRDYLVGAMGQYYTGREQVQRDECMRSGGIAAQTMMLAAKALGYDSCPMDGFDFDAVAKLINLPQDHVIVMMMTIGKALSPARPRGGQLPLANIVVENHF